MPAALARSPAEYFEREAALKRLERDITELSGHINAATYRFLVLVAEFDREHGYARHMLTSTAHWLNWQCGIDITTARQKVRVARALERLPEISAAFERGEVSYSKVRALARVATPENESVLLNVALHGTAAHVEKLVRKYHWCERRDAGKLAHQRYLHRHVSYVYDGSGDFVLMVRLPPEVGAIVRKALEQAEDALREMPEGEKPAWRPENTLVPEPTTSNAKAETSGARRADALRYMAERFLDRRAEETGSWSSADRYQVVVHVDQAVLTEPCRAKDTEPHVCELENGTALAIDTVRRLACGGTLVGMIDDEEGVPLSVGRKTRAIPLAIMRALKARDGGCRFPGCDRTRYVDAHHIVHWANGGETKLSNLVLLCGFHHELLHEGGFSITRTDDGELVFKRPDGRRIAPNGSVLWQRFRGNAVAEPPAEPRIVALNRAAGLGIDASTARCRWGGEVMDYAMAVEALYSVKPRPDPPP